MRKNTLQIDRDTMQEYADFFRFMRESIGLTKRDMAAELGISRHTYARWERGKSIPHQDIDDVEQRIRGVVKVKGRV